MQCSSVIPERDNLFRHSVYPPSFRGKRFARGKLLTLYDGEGHSLLASLAWERYIPTARHVHAYGCRLAAKRNESQRAKGAYRERSRQIYCGVYQLKANAVRALADTDGLSEIL